jgi:hypothetical protein
MNRRNHPLVALMLAGAVCVAPPAATADDVSPPASEWHSYCSAYLKAVDGSAEASDLDVTYCLGITKGLLNGLRIGAQIGALSFGSRLAVRHDLDPDEVFKLFQQQDLSQLLGICSPASQNAAEYVRAVLAHLEKNPGDQKRPIGEVFYEGLEAAYPCR